MKLKEMIEAAAPDCKTCGAKIERLAMSWDHDGNVWIVRQAALQCGNGHQEVIHEAD